ncbi:D-glycero-alpha-D-manno-heptose-1,7-bisphosphate 7-phosphatase [candidate division KSB1 bacterium]
MNKKLKAVFLDRDGTISVEVGYIDNVDDFELYPETAEALALLRRLGYKLVVVTNQSGVARGYFPESTVQEINDKMCMLLRESGVVIDDVYYCPYFEGGSVEEYARPSSCRKPDTGMIAQAVQAHNIDLESSLMIGDSLSDIQCGKNAGIATILVRTGYGRESEQKLLQLPEAEQPDLIAETLYEAALWIKNNFAGGNNE